MLAWEVRPSAVKYRRLSLSWLLLLISHKFQPSRQATMPRPQMPTHQQLTSATKPKSWQQQQRKEWLRGRTFGVAKPSRADNRARMGKVQRKISSQQPRNTSHSPVEDLEEASDSFHSDEELSIFDRVFLAQHGTMGNPQVSLGQSEYLVTIVNGAGEFKFKIGGDVLTSSSLFFRAARSPRWIKPDVPTVVHGNPYLFHRYLDVVHPGTQRQQAVVNAMVWGCNTAPPVDGEIASPDVLELRKAAFETLIGIYILADDLLDPVSANTVIDQMIYFSNATGLVPHLEAINLAYGSTPKDSPLRMLLRDWYVHEVSVTTMEDILASGPHADFLGDMAVENCRLKSVNKQGTIKTCFYQEAARRPDGYYHQRVPESMPAPAQANCSFELVGVVLSE
jgi:hypothetical protein